MRKVQAVSKTFLSEIRVTRSRMPRMKQVVAVGSLLLCVLFATSFLLGQSPVRVADAASFAVACGDVYGDFGLFSRINAANAAAGDDTIALAAGCNYDLTTVADNIDGANGLPSITSNITIAGNGAAIRRDADAPSFRIFRVASGASLALENLTVTNGRGDGSAILNN